MPAVVSISLPNGVIRPDETGNALPLGPQLKAADSAPQGAVSAGLPPVELCHAVNDYYQTWMYEAYGIRHDNFAKCEHEHIHHFGCNRLHRLSEMPAVWLVPYGWLLMGIWLARNHKTQKG